MKINFNLIIRKIKNSLTPDLLQKKYRKLNKNNKTFGHCYVANETLYYMLYKMFKGSDKQKSFVPHYARDSNNIVHWWLQNDKGKILDVTADQYFSVNKKPPYEKGKKFHWLTNKPSRRTKILLKRLKAV
jgi:hypothetical protein